MKTPKEIFKLIKLAPFLKEFTNINPNGGFYHRINGKSTQAGKDRDLTDDDKTQVKNGIDLLITELVELKESLS